MACGRCLIFVFTVTVLSRCTSVKAATPSLFGCPEYVAETRTLSCTCTIGDCPGSYTLSWVGLSQPSEVLVVQQVMRGDDGKRYTCQMICNGQTSTVDYTLRVAYGPNSDNMSTPSLFGCPEYVAETRTLSCTCTLGDCPGSYTLSWVGLSQPSEVLVVQQVMRGDDGKRYTCQMICNGQTSTLDYTLRVAYGPNSDNMSVSGYLAFKTNGTQVLNLTCLATNVIPAAEYVWQDSLCVNASVGNVCSFVPQREDYMKVATCLVRNTGATLLQSTMNVTIDLEYTPPASPHIQGPGQILKAGDTLFCIVTGGKPLVRSVHFSCDNPHHPDQNDVVNSTSVTSNITINTSQANEDNMTCQCSARWELEPNYYPTSVSASFQTEYPAKIMALTMNELNGTVTVNGTTHATLKCEAHGRPRPRITLQGPNLSDLTGNVTHSDDAHSRMEHTIVADNDTQMGNYTCISNNGVGKVADKLITLNVNFPPRLNSSDGPGHSRDTAVNMSEQGINITLRAFPSPHIFRFTGYNDTVGHAGSSSLDYMFNATTSERIPGSPEVTCHIRPEHTVQKGWLYAVNISNGVGSVLYYFSVTGAPPPPEITTSPPGDGGGHRPVIIGASVGGAAAGVILIIIIVCCCKKKSKDERKKQDALFLNVSSSAEERSNPTFNTDHQDTDSGISDRESPPLDMSTSKPTSKTAQHHLDAGYVDVGPDRDGVMRKKSARHGQAYEVTSLVKGGGARIDGKTTNPPATNSKVGYTEPWTDHHIDMPDGQPSVNKPPADTTTAHAGNNASPDHYQGPRGEEYASVGAHGKGGSHSYTNVDSKQKGKPPYSNARDDRPPEVDASGVFESTGYTTVALASHNKGNKAPGKGKQSGAVSTDARGSDTYDHFGGQGHHPTVHADPTYSHIGKL